jgi:hypothetical protein
MDHRRLQRALFRMQHDPAFAARVRSGDETAAASTALGARELALLQAADPVALSADRDGRRADQLLRNVSSEFRLARAIGPDGSGSASWLGGYPGSAVFHDAVSAATPFALGFALFAERIAATAPSRLFRALVALEAAMARARRAAPAQLSVAPGAVIRAGGVTLVDVPANTHAAAAALTAALDAGAPLPRIAPVVDPSEPETLLLVADLVADARFGRLRPLRVEPLTPLVAAFLRSAADPIDGPARAAFAAAHGLAPDDVEAVVRDYVADGVLRLGAARAS